MTAAGGGLTGAVSAEWTKAWSVRATWWSLVAGGLLMAAAAAQTALYTVNANGNSDPADDKGVVTVGSIAVQSLDFAQFGVIALAMLLITAEYATGAIRTTLQWIPRRGVMLLAKTAVSAVIGGVAGAVLAAIGSAVAAPLLGHWGSFAVSGWAGNLLAAGCYLALLCVFTLGIGTALRSSVGTLTVVFLIITVIPASLQASDVAVVEKIAAYLPGTAGSAFMRGDDHVYPHVVGLLILACWTAAALACGLVALRRRDA